MKSIDQIYISWISIMASGLAILFYAPETIGASLICAIISIVSAVVSLKGIFNRAVHNDPTEILVDKYDILLKDGEPVGRRYRSNK